MYRKLYSVFMLSAIIAVAIGTAVATAGSPSVVAVFDPSLGQLPESVTADGEGNFYLSMANTVQKLTPDGTLSLFAQLPIPSGTFALGVKFGPDGDLYVASGGFSPAQDASYVFRISSTGAVTPFVHLDPTGFPNDLAFDDDDNMYVTDPFLGLIWKVTQAGHASVWIEDPLLHGNPTHPALLIHQFGADGIAFDHSKQNLYIGNLDYGTIVRIPVQPGGAAGTPQVWVSDTRLLGCDGIAFDKHDNLYVAVNGQDQVARIDVNGTVEIVASGFPLDAPSAFVFGNVTDRKSLYISSFAINRALGTQPGTPHPSLLKLEVPFAGLAIP